MSIYLYELFRDHTNLLEHAVPWRVRKKMNETAGLEEDTVRTIYSDPMKMLVCVRAAIAYPECKLQDPFIYLKYDSQKIELKTKIIGAHPNINTRERYTEYAKFLCKNGLHEVHVDMSSKTNPVQAVVEKTIKSVIKDHPAQLRISCTKFLDRINRNIMEDYWKPFTKVLSLRLLNLDQFCEVSNLEEIVYSHLEQNNRIEEYEKTIINAYKIYQMFPEQRNNGLFYNITFSPKVRISTNLLTLEQEQNVKKKQFF